MEYLLCKELTTTVHGIDGTRTFKYILSVSSLNHESKWLGSKNYSKIICRCQLTNFPEKSSLLFGDLEKFDSFGPFDPQTYFDYEIVLKNTRMLLSLLLSQLHSSNTG